NPSDGLQERTKPGNAAFERWVAEGRLTPDFLRYQRIDWGILSDQSNSLKVHSSRDDRGNDVRTAHRPFVHELGHALGMPHSGILFGDPVALAAARNNNANACSTYGMGAPYPELSNIMGAGDDVAAVNALPWLHRVVMHLNTPTRPQDW